MLVFSKYLIIIKYTPKKPDTKNIMSPAKYPPVIKTKYHWFNTSSILYTFAIGVSRTQEYPCDSIIQSMLKTLIPSNILKLESLAGEGVLNTMFTFLVNENDNKNKPIEFLRFSIGKSGSISFLFKIGEYSISTPKKMNQRMIENSRTPT